jgi:DNA-binding NarL/FixJ family response regulator
MVIPHSPVRVFLLSDCRLLREGFARVLRDYPAISLVGARELLAVTAAEITESACDVLLIDPINISAFDARILDNLQGKSHDLQIVTIEWELGIIDCVSSILTLTRRKDGFANENYTGL